MAHLDSDILMDPYSMCGTVKGLIWLTLWVASATSGIACEGGKEKGWHMVISKMGKNRENEKEKVKTNTACFITVDPYTYHGFGKGQVLHLKMK